MREGSTPPFPPTHTSEHNPLKKTIPKLPLHQYLEVHVQPPWQSMLASVLLAGHGAVGQLRTANALKQQQGWRPLLGTQSWTPALVRCGCQDTSPSSERTAQPSVILAAQLKPSQDVDAARGKPEHSGAKGDGVRRDTEALFDP